MMNTSLDGLVLFANEAGHVDFQALGFSLNLGHEFLGSPVNRAAGFQHGSLEGFTEILRLVLQALELGRHGDGQLLALVVFYAEDFTRGRQGLAL